MMTASNLKSMSIAAATNQLIGWEREYADLNAKIINALSGPPSMVQKKLEILVDDVSTSKFRRERIIAKTKQDGFSVQACGGRYIIKMEKTNGRR